MGTLGQGDIFLPFAYRQARNACFPMARTQGMGRFKLIYAQGRYPSLAQLVKGSATYRSQTNHYHINNRFFHKTILKRKEKGVVEKTVA
jgi:hypothetical protein